MRTGALKILIAHLQERLIKKINCFKLIIAIIISLMRTPANSTKQFMNDLINVMNSFFKKISNNQIQFQLPEQYVLPKKVELVAKGKAIKKSLKSKVEQNLEKVKLLKKAFKKYKQSLSQNTQFLQESKDLNEKERNRKAKTIWKEMSEESKMKWCTAERKKREAGKTKPKNGQTKTTQKATIKNQKEKTQE